MRPSLSTGRAPCVNGVPIVGDCRFFLIAPRDIAMTFPQTRHTLIERIATNGAEKDWQLFLQDYWGPVCRFGLRRGCSNLQDAEDVAAQTFAALVSNQLLVRWVTQRQSKLRTLLCSVVRNVLMNRVRIDQGRQRLAKENYDVLQGRQGLPIVPSLDVPAETMDAFYAAWVDDLLAQVIERLLHEYHHAGKGDSFRTLYGRLCERMTFPQIAESLRLPLTTVENYFKSSRKRLAELLETAVREHVGRYCAAEQLDEDFRLEWAQLGDYLTQHGGLEEAVRRSYEQFDFSEWPARRASALDALAARLKQD